jgi:hypothetical protein
MSIATLNKVKTKLPAGQSVCIISLPGFGKSRFGRKLALESTKTHQFIFVDLNQITPLTSNNFIQHLHLLLIPKTLLPTEIVQTTYNLNQFFINSPPLTLIIDKASLLNNKDQIQTNNILKSFRDQNKKNITYVFLSDPTLFIPPNHLDNLYDIVAENIIFLPASNGQDLDQKIITIAKDINFKPTNHQTEQIKTLSGGIPGLIKSCLLSFQNKQAPTISNPKILGLLKQINPFLQKKHIEVADKTGLIDSKGQIRSLLLKDYLNSLKPKIKLTKTEHLIFSHLKKHKNKICTRDNLIKAGWPNDNQSGVSNHAIDQIISRLRQKLSSSTYTITTVPTRGYILKIS